MPVVSGKPLEQDKRMQRSPKELGNLLKEMRQAKSSVPHWPACDNWLGRLKTKSAKCCRSADKYSSHVKSLTRLTVSMQATRTYRRPKEPNSIGKEKGPSDESVWGQSETEKMHGNSLECCGDGDYHVICRTRVEGTVIHSTKICITRSRNPKAYKQIERRMSSRQWFVGAAIEPQWK